MKVTPQIEPGCIPKKWQVPVDDYVLRHRNFRFGGPGVASYNLKEI